MPLCWQVAAHARRPPLQHHLLLLAGPHHHHRGPPDAHAAPAPASSRCIRGDDVWDELHTEAQADADAEPVLHKFSGDLVLSRPLLEGAHAAHLSNNIFAPVINKGANTTMMSRTLITEANMMILCKTFVALCMWLRICISFCVYLYMFSFLCN